MNQAKHLISTIIPTYKREHLLSNAVNSVLEQDVADADIEVVVVDDSGEGIADADWKHDPRVTVVNTNHTERCFARNTGAALTKGEFLNFLDDDDILLPGAYASLMEVVHRCQAQWVTGGVELIRDGDPVQIMLPTWDGMVFAMSLTGPLPYLQSSLIRRGAFFDAGGFDPNFGAHEDSELFQRITMRGRVANTHQVVARVIAGRYSADSLSLWSETRNYARISRDKAFDDPDCYPAIVKSLRENNDSWRRGRLARYYFGSAMRQARRKSMLIALSRLLLAMRLSLPGLMSPAFWSSLNEPGETND